MLHTDKTLKDMQRYYRHVWTEKVRDSRICIGMYFDAGMKEGVDIGLYGGDDEENCTKWGVRTGNWYKCDLRMKKSTYNRKLSYEETMLVDCDAHIDLEVAIRRYLKALNKHFQGVEAHYGEIEQNRRNILSRKWKNASDHAIINHQDAMTKVYLPYFCVTATSNITRFSFDVKGHVNTVTNESIVLSNELGSPPNNNGEIMESVIIGHVLRCRGRRSTWLSVIMPQSETFGWLQSR